MCVCVCVCVCVYVYIYIYTYIYIYIHSWCLNNKDNMSLNCTSPLICGFFVGWIQEPGTDASNTLLFKGQLYTYVSVCVCAQLCPTLCNPMDCSPPGSSVHGIFLARILEQVATSSCRGSARHKDWTHVSCVSCIGRQILSRWATWETQI